jgi:hypothetical protein
MNEEAIRALDRIDVLRAMSVALHATLNPAPQ